MPPALTALTIVILSPLAAYGALGVVHPELAFRLENIFQLRQVELSTFGLFVHQFGGFVAVLVCLLLAVAYGGLVAAVVVSIAALAVPAYHYRHYGRWTADHSLL